MSHGDEIFLDTDGVLDHLADGNLPREEVEAGLAGLRDRMTLSSKRAPLKFDPGKTGKMV